MKNFKSICFYLLIATFIVSCNKKDSILQVTPTSQGIVDASKSLENVEPVTYYFESLESAETEDFLNHNVEPGVFKSFGITFDVEEELYVVSLIPGEPAPAPTEPGPTEARKCNSSSFGTAVRCFSLYLLSTGGSWLDDNYCTIAYEGAGGAMTYEFWNQDCCSLPDHRAQFRGNC